MDIVRAVKTGYPVRNRPAHDGLGLFRAGQKGPEDKQAHKYLSKSVLCRLRAFELA